MTVFSTFHPTALYAGDFPRVTRLITVASGQNLKRGALLGRITATDKYVLSVKSASDGSQNPVGVLAFDVDATSADVTAAKAYTTGEYAGEVMTIDASWTIAQVEAALRVAGLPLFVRSVGTIA